MDDSTAPQAPELTNGVINSTIPVQYDRWISKTIRGKIYWGCEYCGKTVFCMIKHAGASSVCPACSERIIYPRPEEATRFGGISRRKFAICLLIYGICTSLLISIFSPNAPIWKLGIISVTYVGLLGFLFRIIKQRIINTGRSQKLIYKFYVIPYLLGSIMFGAVLCIPITGIIKLIMMIGGFIASVSYTLALFGLVAEQEGYIISKKLDTTGIIFVTFIVSVVVAIAIRALF